MNTRPHGRRSQQTATLTDVCRFTSSIRLFFVVLLNSLSATANRSNVMRDRRRPYNVIIFNRFLKWSTGIRLEYIIIFLTKFPSRLYVSSAYTYYIIWRQFIILWRMPTAIALLFANRLRDNAYECLLKILLEFFISTQGNTIYCSGVPAV